MSERKFIVDSSRNDQVLVDLKLFTRAELKEVVEEVEQTFSCADFSKQYI